MWVEELMAGYYLNTHHKQMKFIITSLPTQQKLPRTDIGSLTSISWARDGRRIRLVGRPVLSLEVSPIRRE
jgi:hypothetical protein